MAERERNGRNRRVKTACGNHSFYLGAKNAYARTGEHTKIDCKPRHLCSRDETGECACKRVNFLFESAPDQACTQRLACV